MNELDVVVVYFDSRLEVWWGGPLCSHLGHRFDLEYQRYSIFAEKMA